MFKWELINDETGEKQILQTDPHGWEDISLEHNRSEKYDGMFLDFSRDLSFHCKGGGKEMIDTIYDQKGSEGNATLIVYFSCNDRFKRLFEGFLNFATYRQEIKGRTLHTTVEVRKKGITQTVMSRDDTDVDILSETSIGGVALNPYTFAPYTLQMHSKTVFLETRWKMEAANTFNSGTEEIPTGTTRRFFHTHAFPVVIQDLEQSLDSIDFWSFGNITLEDSDITAIHDTTLASPRITPATYTWSYSTSGIFKWLTNGGTGGILSVTFVVRKHTELSGAGTFLSSKSLTVPSGLGDKTIPYDLSDSGTVVMQDNDKIWAYWTIVYTALSGTGNDFFDVQFEVNDLSLSIETNSTVAATEAKAVAIHEAWSRICEGITDQTLAFKSEFFGRTNSQGLKYSDNGYGSFTAITDGLRIRGFEKSDNAILTDGQTKKGVITTLKDMYDSCNAIWGVGLGIEDHNGTEVVRVEEKDYFFSNKEIYKISDIPNLEMSFAEEMVYSEVQNGYEKWKIENKGGLDEPNTIARWVFPKIKNIKNVKELVSSYVAGMYPIEWTRRSRIEFNVTGDSDYDDDIFIIALNREVDRGAPRQFSIPERGDLLGVSVPTQDIQVNPDTLLAPTTAYNLRFNLFSNFDRTMNQFTTGLTKDSPQPINYSYFEGNGQMEFQVVGFQAPDTHPGNLNNLVSKNVQNTSFPSGRHKRQYPILLPEIYTFSYPIPFSDYIDIISNPYGYISFSESDKKYKKGYIKTLSYNIARQMAEFTLIRKFD